MRLNVVSVCWMGDILIGCMCCFLFGWSDVVGIVMLVCICEIVINIEIFLI